MSGSPDFEAVLAGLRAGDRTMPDSLVPALHAEMPRIASSPDPAINRPEEIDQRQARIVELRFFSGLSVHDTAAALAMSPATATPEWHTARARP